MRSPYQWLHACPVGEMPTHILLYLASALPALLPLLPDIYQINQDPLAVLFERHATDGQALLRRYSKAKT